MSEQHSKNTLIKSAPNPKTRKGPNNSTSAPYPPNRIPLVEPPHRERIQNTEIGRASSSGQERVPGAHIRPSQRRDIAHADRPRLVRRIEPPAVPRPKPATGSSGPNTQAATSAVGGSAWRGRGFDAGDPSCRVSTLQPFSGRLGTVSSTRRFAARR